MGQDSMKHDVPSLGSTLWAGIADAARLPPRQALFGLSRPCAQMRRLRPRLWLRRSGDGPAVFVILVDRLRGDGLALFTEMRYTPPYWLHAALWGPLAILVPLILLRSFKGVLIALQFRHKAEQGKLASE